MSKDQKEEEFDFKSILNRSLQCVKKKKHIDILSAYGKLQFEHGNKEMGRTTFEAIITQYPKRTDIWIVYLDCEIKAKSVK